MNLFELFVKVGVDDQASSKISSITSKLGSGLKTAAAVATTAVAAASAAVVAFGKSAVDAGMQFDSSMSQVAATMGYTVAEINQEGSEANKTFQQLREFAMEMGSTTAFSASQAADALNYMALAGYDAETSIKMLPNVLDLAAAGGIELAYASDMITDSQSALGLSLEETSELVDKMARASSKSNTSVAQLGEAILTVGGTAKNLKGGTTELATALGILADNGVKGSEGGTALRNIILSLAAPTENATTALHEFGGAEKLVFDEAGNMKSLNDIFMELNNITAEMTQAERIELLNTMFNKRDLKSVEALLANVGDRYNELSLAIDGAWYTNESLSKSFAGIGIDMSKMQSNLNKLGIDTNKFSVALDASTRDAELFADMLWEAADYGVKYDDILDALGGSLDDIQTAFNNTTGAAKAMAETQLDNLEGDITLFKSALEGAQIVINDQLKPSLRDFVQFGASSISTLTKAFQEDGLSGAMSALGGVISDGVALIVSKLPEVVDAGVQLLSALGQGIIDNKDVIFDAALDIIMTLADVILSGLPQVIKLGLDLIVSLTMGIADAIRNDDFIGTIVDVIVQIVNILTDPSTLKNLFQAALILIESIAIGIIDNLPLLIDAAVQLVMNLVEFITDPDNIKMLIEMATGLIIKIGEALVNALPKLIDAAVQLVLNLIDFITDPDNIEMLIEMAITLIETITEALITAIPLLIDATIKIITKLCEFFLAPDNIEMLMRMSFELIQAIIKGWLNAELALKEGVAKLVATIIGKFKETDWEELGHKIIENLLDGFKSRWEVVRAWFDGAVGSIKKIIEDITNAINSVMGKKAEMEVGVNSSMQQIIDMDKALNNSSSASTADTFGKSSKTTPNVSVTQNIYSSAKTPSELLAEAMYQQEKAVFVGV